MVVVVHPKQEILQVKDMEEMALHHLFQVLQLLMLAVEVGAVYQLYQQFNQEALGVADRQAHILLTQQLQTELLI